MSGEPNGGEAPCFSHLLVDGHPIDPDTLRDVTRFRRAERQRLYEVRKSFSPEQRGAATESIIQDMKQVTGPLKGRRIAVYWPMLGEPDMRPWMKEAHSEGAQILLPEVVVKKQPLQFREWQPGARMARGIWNIPVPADGAVGTPDLVISPLVGVDDACFRLGNGGGYYDMTLASLSPRPQIIGIGLPGCAIPTIFPMPWDIPMDVVVLGDSAPRERVTA